MSDVLIVEEAKVSSKKQTGTLCGPACKLGQKTSWQSQRLRSHIMKCSDVLILTVMFFFRSGEPFQLICIQNIR